jgi:hypothetical protein
VSPAALRWLERVHAIVAWAATVALLGAAFLGARARPLFPRRAARIAGATAVGLLGAAGGLGLALHEPYRERLRQRLFLGAPALGWLFERKQSAAFAAVLLAVSALATRAYLERVGPAAPGARDLRRSAALAWTASAALALAASIASAIVARRAHF